MQMTSTPVLAPLFRSRRDDDEGILETFDEQPLRAELFSVDQLERHARAQAGWHRVDPSKGPDRLLDRLDENERILRKSYDIIAAALAKGRRIYPAGEWLLDNFFLIETQIRMARLHLPRGYSRELPRLANGPMAGYPRAYELVLELISHVDGLVDYENLSRFVAAYQSVAVLRVGELWAIPIMLRLGLIENLRRVATRVAGRRQQRDAAASWADRMTATAQRDPKSLIPELAELVRSNPPLSTSFVAEFVQRLQGRNPHLGLAIQWVEQQLAESGQTTEQLIQAESQHQATDQISIGNSINSLRFLSSADWKDFVEEQSVVETALRQDPSGIYTQQTFATRDRYRHAVESIAKRSERSEEQVARLAVELASAAMPDADGDDRRRHVGHFLVGPGRRELEALTLFRPPVLLSIRRAASKMALPLYLGAIAIVTTLLTVVVAAALPATLPGWLYAGLVILLIVAFSQAAVSVVNWVATMLVSPRMLSRLDFSGGIPDSARSVVVVPTLLTSPQNVADLVEGLEVRYLANRDGNLWFALLTDFADAPQQDVPQDAELLQLAVEGIERLNTKYASDRGGPFLLAHRPREFNPKEGVWMGHERKRGKLAQFNALIRGGRRDAFIKLVGNVDALQSVRYVITLDTDTQLPRGAAWKLVGSMAHPLNRPRFDDRLQRVVQGYTLLQPRVAISLPGASKSRYARLMSGDAGLDPYTQAVSDLYQDAFAEGSFIGKGIYDVEMFERVLNGRFPDNHILSHDLLEGNYVRCALLTDVELIEEHPARYTADIARRHRWIRGDWQIAEWGLLPRVPTAGGRTFNPLSTLARWKVVDNLRRSLVPIALLSIALIAWFALPGEQAWVPWVVILAATLLQPLLGMLADMVRVPREQAILLHVGNQLRAGWRSSAQSLLRIIFLPYEAWVSLNAIGKVLWRRFVTGRRLLEWTTSTDAERRARTDLGGIAREMWAAPAATLVVCLALLLMPWPEFYARSPWAIPLITAWLFAPLLAFVLSRPLGHRAPPLTPPQQTFLRQLSRRTWRYFEVFVRPEDNWLPPDNFQEEPAEVVASRTSPTNMGMALLSTVAAQDFGYITPSECIDRVERTIAAMEKLERYNGHFYNWYDTRTLKPILPLYISAVDSGNLTANLVVLRAALEELPATLVLHPQAFAGLSDTLQLLKYVARGNPVDSRGVQTSPEVRNRIEALEQEFTAPPKTVGPAIALCARLNKAAGEIVSALGPGPDPEVAWWAAAFARETKSLQEDLITFAGYAELSRELAREPEVFNRPPQPLAATLQPLVARIRQLQANTTFDAVARLEGELSPQIEQALSALTAADQQPARDYLTALRARIRECSRHASARIEAARQLAERVSQLNNADYSFLYDKDRELFHIGYNVLDHRLDPGLYDLLASEARVASFTMIARGQVPQEHWFALGRQLTRQHGENALLSWSGSMFEYLMPLLIMPTYEGTLLDQTYRGVLIRQMQYGRQRKLPWGISESCYSTTDTHFNYQYKAFGVPGLGLKRGLGDDLVIAPYASVMGLMVLPRPSCENLMRLADEGILARYGMYEAIDYTTTRVPADRGRVVCRCFMSHHSGMSLLSLAYVLLDRPMQRRFMADPAMQATALLLQERVPSAVGPTYSHAGESQVAAAAEPTAGEAAIRSFSKPTTPLPEVHLLSNGRYHVMINNAGSGYSRFKDYAVTRWREDLTTDCVGQFCYVRDVQTGRFWSTAYQPTRQQTPSYYVTFSQARAEFRRYDEEIDTYQEISVSPEDDVEVRRVTLTNVSRSTRVIELTSYLEPVINKPGADAAHRTFSNLFVQTELFAQRSAIIATRRPRSQHEQHPVLFHLMRVNGTPAREVSFETDRNLFVGRGRSLDNPQAMYGRGRMHNSAGAVLDPVCAIRQTVSLKPEEFVKIDIITGMAADRAVAEQLVDKYQDRRLVDRVFEVAWTHSQVLLRQLGATELDAQLFGRLAGSVIYANSLYRANPALIAQNRRGQSNLWAYAISGDLPIVLVRLADSTRMDLVRQVLQAHGYWRAKGLAVDLILWNDDFTGYRQVLSEQISALIASGPEAGLLDKPGGIFIRRTDQISDDDRLLLESVARVVLTDSGGTLTEQVDRRPRGEVTVAKLSAGKGKRADAATDAPPPRRDLMLFNGLGGFTNDGREYVIILPRGNATPAPWVNVLAGEYAGSVISEQGSAYTWVTNAHEYRLTPWNNDPVVDPAGEAFFIRDDETGRFWSPCPFPARGANTYVCRHGIGYTAFEYLEAGVQSEFTQFMAMDGPVKCVVLKLRNVSGRPRKITCAGFVEWVLGEHRHNNAMHVVTEAGAEGGAVFARNEFVREFAHHVAFFATSELIRTASGDRSEFIGRGGSLSDPAAMRRVKLSGKLGAALDPCAALMTPFELADGQQRELVFVLGAGRDRADAEQLVGRFASATGARRALEAVHHFWNTTLAAVHVDTPESAINVLANCWLPYQTLSCRIWARSGFYQSGGAYGFRDQLQDAMAIVHAHPQMLRKQILLHASRQFKEGDVQHWWHPPSGRGVRTHFSDDYLWLPYAVSRYVSVTGDRTVLDEVTPFLEGRLLRPEEESYYDSPHTSHESGSVYEHCLRAIRFGLSRMGPHRLPLMGCGDWNDGMNLVGEHGRGESVWLAFFIADVLAQFEPLAGSRSDAEVVQLCREQREALRHAIEEHAWDGAWYRRAYFDDGTPLGSSQSPECQIDSLPQSWAVISGIGQPERVASALASVDRWLVRRDLRIVELFDPPFDASPLNPGYIKGYLPGVRENGAQYTHAAAWAVMAFALSGDFDKAWELMNFINPVNHAASSEAAQRYKVEPYVIAADVYSNPQHAGRGGWTWYTGSAGWIYRVMVETLLGISREANTLRITPRVPHTWKSYRVNYRHGEATYHITVNVLNHRQPPSRVVLDGRELSTADIPLVTQAGEHHVEVTLGTANE